MYKSIPGACILHVINNINHKNGGLGDANTFPFTKEQPWNKLALRDHRRQKIKKTASASFALPDFIWLVEELTYKPLS